MGAGSFDRVALPARPEQLLMGKTLRTLPPFYMANAPRSREAPNSGSFGSRSGRDPL